MPPNYRLPGADNRPVDELTSSLRQARDWYMEGVNAVSGKVAFNRSTLCAGWTAANVVGHVAVGDRYFRGLLEDATGQDHQLLAGLPSEREGRVQLAQAMAGWQPERLLEAAEEESERVVSGMQDAMSGQPGLMVRMPFGEVPLSRAVEMRRTEYIVHGHDLEPAIGSGRPFPEWFIDTALPLTMQMVATLHSRSAHRGDAASFHFHRTDGEGEWTIRAEGGHARTEPGHQRADVAFRGPGSGIYWMVMGRGGPAALGVEVKGESGLAAAFKEWFPGP
jgi:uncharacterized protein (TIGR03083 family)